MKDANDSKTKGLFWPATSDAADRAPSFNGPSLANVQAQLKASEKRIQQLRARSPKEKAAVEVKSIKPASSGRGGKRAGSGRKPLDEAGSIITTVRLTGEQKATFDMLGGVTWLREQLQAVIQADR